MEQGQSIFVGNIKGGVGKSTITAFLYDYFRTFFQRSIQMLGQIVKVHPLNCLVLLLTNVISVMFLS